MSFREQTPSEETVEAVTPPPPPRRVFSEGLCNVCMKAMLDHPEDEDGKVRDCNGWECEFIDREATVELRALEAKARAASQELK